jgi:hypothetical protein
MTDTSDVNRFASINTDDEESRRHGQKNSLDLNTSMPQKFSSVLKDINLRQMD